MAIEFVDELKWRGLLHQATDEAGLGEHLRDPGHSRRRGYAGFDPTADSLTIGNLVPIMLLVHFARAGHEPVVVMGGGTGLIGDPSGKSAERQLLTEEVVAAHVEQQRPIFERVFGNAGLGAPTIRNNLDWLGKLGYIEVLRDVGKHFSVNVMMQKDSVRDRLHGREQGISYTEFSYQVLQAYDFWRLFREEGVTVQMGGSDQWGNIVAGADLIRRLAAAPAWEIWRRMEEARKRGEQYALSEDEQRILHESQSGKSPADVFGLTAPLVTKADGGKFGKTESGAIWLTPERTSPYAYFQFWLNAADADVIRFLKIFTLLDRDEIAELERTHEAEPGRREAHRRLAREATTLVHGAAEAEQAEGAAKALFSGEVSSLDARTLEEVFAEVPSSEHAKADLEGEGLGAVELLMRTSLVKSKREAREFLSNGAVTVNGRRMGLEDRVTTGDLLHGKAMAVRRGKKAWHVLRWK